MTTPADNTPISLIQDAYFEAGIIQLGDSCDPEQIVLGMRRLTRMINYWQTKGLKLWLNVDTSVPLVVGQGTYTFAPTGDVVMTKPLRVIEAYFLDSTGIRTPLIPLSWDDYIRLSQINVNGAINSYFINKKATELDVFFWYPPDATAATGTGHVLLQTQVTGPINITEEMNFPIEWGLALMWGLADQTTTGQPQAIIEKCATRAEMYRMALEDWDVEDAPTQFQPDQRAMQYQGKFR